MLSKILGTIWIILGILWLIKPEGFRNRLKRKMNRKMRRIVLGFLLVFAFLMIGSVFKAPGVLAKIIGVIGIIIVIRGILLLTSKASEKMREWLSERPLMYFRICASILLVIGLLMVFV